MSAETIPQHVEKEPRLANEAYSQSLDQLEELVPELGHKRDALIGAASEIVEVFQLDPSIFEDSGRSLIFSALADRWSSLANLEGDEKEDELEFLTNGILMLGENYLPNADKIAASELIKETKQLEIYDKFTDKQLSHEMTNAIDGGLLDSIKERMGISSENEDPFEVRVMSISGHYADAFGLEAEQPDYDNLPNDPKAVLDTISDADNERNVVDTWKKGLDQRGTEFAAELGVDKVFASAWVTRLKGKTLLCMPIPVAEKILHPELTKNSSVYTADSYERDFAYLEHEYVHTQGGVNIDQGLDFGINLEELRAEYFSGNKQGYQDIKGFFSNYATITDENQEDIFEKNKKGGDALTVYSSIANRVGLRSMLEITMAAPNNYIEHQSEKRLTQVNEYIGRFDGILSRLIEQEMAAGRGNKLETQIEERAQSVYKIFEGKNNALGVETFQAMREKMGLKVVEELVTKKVVELRSIRQ